MSQEADMETGYKFDHKLLALQTPGEVNVLFDLTAPNAPQDAEREPLATAVVIDRSGSMTGHPLALAAEAAAHFIAQLRADDDVALVAFDDQAVLVSSLGSAARPELPALLAGIAPGGCTNLSGGWLKGGEELRHADGAKPRRVLLLTDGLANQGITDPDQLTALAATARADSIGTSTIGLGEHFDEDLLTQMADAGGGNAHRAKSPEDLPGLFVREFERLSTLVAQNVSVEIRPSKDFSLVQVLHDYPLVSVGDGVQVQIGDCYGGNSRSVLFRLRVPGMEDMGPTKIGEVVLRWTSIGETVALHEQTIPLLANVASKSEAAAAGLDDSVTEQVILLSSVRAQKQARDLADGGDFGRAADLLNHWVGELRRAPHGPHHDRVVVHAERLADQAERMSDGGFDADARMTMTFQSRNLRNQDWDALDD